MWQKVLDSVWACIRRLTRAVGSLKMETRLNHILESKTLDELTILARAVRLTGYSSLRKLDLVGAILSADRKALSRALNLSWWDINWVGAWCSVVGVPLALFGLWLATPGAPA